jgi:hypothetical protein
MTRTRFQGVRTVVRFNWPLYAAAIAVLAIALTAALTDLPLWLRCLAGAATLGALWFLVGSLGVTHWVYDRSDLYRWDWLRQRVPDGSFRLLLCHTGFDEVSAALRRHFPQTELEILDHFDPVTMTEASIQRARALCPPAEGTMAAPFSDWPKRSAEVILAPLAIHELRTESERAAWFEQAREALTPDGLIIVVEHLRDLPNFLAFGPGFLHFHSETAWLRSWSAAGLTLSETFSITPWVRGFVLK